MAIGSDRYIACKDCGHFICTVDANYKLGAARIDGSLTEIDPELFPDPAIEFDMPIVYRQYLCPNCGVLLENELVRGGRAAGVGRPFGLSINFTRFRIRLRERLSIIG